MLRVSTETGPTVRAVWWTGMTTPRVRLAAGLGQDSGIAEKQGETMTQIVLTCVKCGKSEKVKDTPENKRDRKCKACGESMVVKRPPGNTKTS
jgi:DNA-directed RNA polymerase subunit RPC12/RpoP